MVFIWGENLAFVLEAVFLGVSLLKDKTRHRVAMVEEKMVYDHPEWLTILQTVWECQQFSHLTEVSLPADLAKATVARLEGVWSKLLAWGADTFDKVLLLDTDLWVRWPEEDAAKESAVNKDARQGFS